MQALIDFIIRNLLNLWPIARVYSWEMGLRVRGGVAGVEVLPGLHWRWPFLDQVYREVTAEQTCDLPVVRVTTPDLRTVNVSANFAYRIVSPRALWLRVHRAKDSMANVATGFLADRCAGQPWAELVAGRAALQLELAKYLSVELAGWGIEVTRVFLTDFVEARQYSIFNDTPGR